MLNYVDDQMRGRFANCKKKLRFATHDRSGALCMRHPGVDRFSGFGTPVAGTSCAGTMIRS
jgi:hypothetical protein